jgi:flagellar biosynthesis anti-sigma factor FlgM
MRIDSNQVPQPPPESGRITNPGPVGGDAPSSAGSSWGEDRAQFSGAQTQVQALTEQALQFPEVRGEKVNALRQEVLSGSYQVSPKQLTDAVFEHMAAEPAA